VKILILGAGAIGLVFGGFLAKSGHSVVLFGKNRVIDPINNQGLSIEGIWGNHQINILPGYNNFSNLRKNEESPFDLVLLTVKSYDTRKILKDFKEHVPDPVPVISLQNGLGNLETVSGIAGKNMAMAGRVIFGAEICNSATVRVTVCAEEVRLGGLPDGINHDIVKDTAELFDNAGIPTLPTREIETYIWGKALYNCALNGLGAILNVNYGLLMKHASTKALISDLVQEIFLIIKKEKKKVKWSNASSYLQDLFERLIPLTYDHYPSMLRDIQNNKRTEIDALNGAIVNIARKHGADVPVNWLVTKLVTLKEKIALGQKRGT